MFRRNSLFSKPANAGQATVEYILVLAFSVSLFILIFKGVIAPMVTRLQQGIERKMMTLFSGDNLHRSVFGK